MMTNEEVKNLVPEVLKQFDIDWKLYKPAGGWEWNRHFRSYWIPEIEKRIGEFKRIKAAKTEFSSRADELIRELSGVHSTFQAIDMIVKSGKGINPIQDNAELKEWISQAPKAIMDIVCAIAEERDTSGPSVDSDTEISYLESLRDYFMADLELDMLMWALGSVEMKYRTKIFRVGYKKLEQVELLRFKVENAKCKSRDMFWKHFEKPIMELRECYEGKKDAEDPQRRIGFTKLLRLEKKALDKMGSMWWKNRDSVDSVKLRQDASALAGAWGVSK